MTTPRDPDEILSAWLDEGPTRIPDQTRRAIAVAIPTTTQRRRGWTAPWRHTPMSPLARAAAAVLVVAVLGIGALFVLRPSNGVASPSVIPSPSSAVACSQPIADGVPLLDPDCRYTSKRDPAFSVGGVPDFYGGIELARGTELRVRVPSLAASDEPGTVRVLPLDNVMTKPCDNEWTYNVNQPTSPWAPASATTGPADFFAWLAANTPLPTDTQKVTIDGHEGLTATYALDPGYLSDCGGGAGTVFITDYGSTSPTDSKLCGVHVGTCELWIEDGASQTRLTALEVGGKVVLIAVQGKAPAFDDILAAADKVIATMQFK